MEDDLKILKVEYLSNHWSDLPQILNLSLRDQTKMLEINTTSNGRWLQNIKIGIYQQSLLRSASNFKLKLRGPNQIEYCLKWNRSLMEDIKSGISHHSLIGSSSSNFKLKLRGLNQKLKMIEMKTTTKGKRP